MARRIRPATSDSIGTQQWLADGQTDDAWLQAYCDVPTVPGFLADRRRSPDTTAYIDLDGLPAAGGTIMPGGKIFDVAVAGPGPRAYVFTLDGNVDRAMLDAFLSTVSLQPYNAHRHADADRHVHLADLRLLDRDAAGMDGHAEHQGLDRCHQRLGGHGRDRYHRRRRHRRGVPATRQTGHSTEFLAAFEAEQHAVRVRRWGSSDLASRSRSVTRPACSTTRAAVPRHSSRPATASTSSNWVTRPSAPVRPSRWPTSSELLKSVIFDPASAK